MSLKECLKHCQLKAEAYGELDQVWEIPETFESKGVRKFDTQPFYVAEIGDGVREAVRFGKFADGKRVSIWGLDTGADEVHIQRGDLQHINVVENATTDRTAFDFNGHGSWILGAIGANSDGNGIEGVLPECDLNSIKVLSNEGSGAVSWIAAGVRYAADQGADVISMSLGGGYSQTIEDEIIYARRKGVYVVAAMGNSGNRGGGHPGTSDYTDGITAMDDNDNLANFSSRDRQATFVDRGVNTLSLATNGRYQRISGTSMSCPVAAAKIAAIKIILDDHYGRLPTVEQIYEAALASVRDLGTRGHDIGYGHGQIMLDKVLELFPPKRDTPNDPEEPTEPKPCCKVTPLVITIDDKSWELYGKEI